MYAVAVSFSSYFMLSYFPPFLLHNFFSFPCIPLSPFLSPLPLSSLPLFFLLSRSLSLLPPLSLQEELSLAGYHGHMEAAKAAPPLTREEQELKDLNEAQVVPANALESVHQQPHV